MPKKCLLYILKNKEKNKHKKQTLFWHFIYRICSCHKQNYAKYAWTGLELHAHWQLQKKTRHNQRRHHDMYDTRMHEWLAWSLAQTSTPWESMGKRLHFRLRVRVANGLHCEIKIKRRTRPPFILLKCIFKFFKIFKQKHTNVQQKMKKYVV